MVMCDAPLISLLADKHSEARRSRCCLAVHHTGKCVEAGDHGSAIANCNGAPLFDPIRVAASLYRTEVLCYRFRPFGDDWTNSSEQDCGRTIGFGNGLWIVGAVRS